MINDNELGNIEFVRTERAKHIRVRIQPSGLKVSLPMHVSQNEAMKFINSVRQKLIDKKESLQNNLERSNVFIDENSSLQTLTFTVKALRVERSNIHFSLKNELLKIEFPINTDCSKPEVQKNFWNGISYFLRKEAKRLLPDRTKQLAQKFGFTYTAVKIQSSKSRWGSCSRQQNINLSLYLLLLPQHLIDYVILHELCHTKEMNHGRNFWIWMDRVTDAKSAVMRAELKKYTMPQ